MAATEAQIKAIRKYEQEKIERVTIRFPKGTKEQILFYDDSVNHFVNEAVKYYVEYLDSKR